MATTEQKLKGISSKESGNNPTNQQTSNKHGNNRAKIERNFQQQASQQPNNNNNMSNTRYTLFTHAVSKFLVNNLSATSVDQPIEMLRLEETFISGNKETVVDVVPHSFRGNSFLFALHVPKSHIKQTTPSEIEEVFARYFEPYIIPGYMWVKLAEYPEVTYRFTPEREVEKVISLEDTYLLHIEVRYTNAKYIPDSVNHGYDYPFPVVNPDTILSRVKRNELMKQEESSDAVPGEEPPLDQDVAINTLKMELSAEKTKVSALQHELRIQEEMHNSEKEDLTKELDDTNNQIVHLEVHAGILRRTVKDLQTTAKNRATQRGETAKTQQEFIRKLYAETSREEDCPICYETITSENLYVSDCCHVYCMSCARGCYKANQKCALCRTDLGIHNKAILCPPVKEPLSSMTQPLSSMTQPEIMSVAQQIWSRQPRLRELLAIRDSTNNEIDLVETDEFIPFQITPDETPHGSPRTISATV